MLLIADSGSTKCDWMIVRDNGEPVTFKTMGINPFFHSELVIESELRKVDEVIRYKNDISQIYFYGAGSSSDHYKAIVKRGLRKIFSHANIHVDHDLNGAALATWQGEPAISCILGTGSNSCFYDGHKLTEKHPALGYILGDEGSGSYFGKRLFRDLLYHRLPKIIEEDLTGNYGISKEIIFENVYEKPHANVYLASFMKFIGKYKSHPYVNNMILEGFKDFLDTHVLCFENCREVKTNFVGSVAHHFEDELRSACEDRGLIMGNIVCKPIFGLKAYHENNINTPKN